MNKTLQSGNKYGYQWQLVWKNRERWSNPLMGWTSSADPMSMTIYLSIYLIINQYDYLSIYLIIYQYDYLSINEYDYLSI
jgi:hypothetical protein